MGQLRSGYDGPYECSPKDQLCVLTHDTPKLSASVTIFVVAMIAMRVIAKVIMSSKRSIFKRKPA